MSAPALMIQPLTYWLLGVHSDVWGHLWDDLTAEEQGRAWRQARRVGFAPAAGALATALGKQKAAEMHRVVEEYLEYLAHRIPAHCAERIDAALSAEEESPDDA